MTKVRAGIHRPPGLPAHRRQAENENSVALLHLPNAGLGHNETKFIEASEVIPVAHLRDGTRWVEVVTMGAAS